MRLEARTPQIAIKIAKNEPLLAAILVSGCGFWLVYLLEAALSGL